MNAVPDLKKKHALLLALVLVLASPWALARPGNERHQARQDNRQYQQQPNSPQRDFRRQEFQRGNEGAESFRSQRLSPEERRQLRRDIRDAGREIYPRQ